MRIPALVLGVLLLQTASAAQAPTGNEAAQRIQSSIYKGDLDGIRERRVLRVGVAYNRTHFFIDQGVQRGLAYEAFKLFEDQLNAGIKKQVDKVHVVFLVMSRSDMEPALLNGHVDLLAANITITPERRQRVDFSNPIRSDVNEIVVSGPGAKVIRTKADLAGEEVIVRTGSLYHYHLMSLNTRLKAQGLAEMKLRLAPDVLEDDDILEMVNAGLAKHTVVDNYLAEFWSQIFKGLTLRPTAALTVNGEIAVAMRPNSPQLKTALNTWVKKNGEGSLFGNMMTKRYLADTKFARNATSPADIKKFEQIIAFFRKYGGQYKVDSLLMAAQGYQESGLNQNVRSRVGAIGVMQVMPATGKELAVGNIRQLEPNIHAGVKYMRFMMDEYFKGEPIDELNKGLLAFASYNAGPNRIRQLRAETKARGLDPNKWFNNVEQIVSEKIGRETVTYVSNIFKYYVAYSMVMEQEAERAKARAQH